MQQMQQKIDHEMSIFTTKGNLTVNKTTSVEQTCNNSEAPSANTQTKH